MNEKQNSLVWYACYGSNIMYERFLCYIQGGIFYANEKYHKGCSDRSPPRSSKPVLIPYEMYFGKESQWWDNGGVAFLDISKKSVTLGRMYLITDEQFKNVWEQEGNSKNWYYKEIPLGEYKGYPVKTFTNSERLPENAPSEKYLDVIRNGIGEIIPDLAIINIS